MKNIGISEALAQMDATLDGRSNEVRTFQIHFLTEEGKAPQYRVRKYTTKSSFEQKRSKTSFNLQSNGVMMFNELDNGRIINVKVATIFGFKEYSSTDWLNVKH